jgi:uncharacterized protein (DUF1501 family)
MGGCLRRAPASGTHCGNAALIGGKTVRRRDVLRLLAVLGAMGVADPGAALAARRKTIERERKKSEPAGPGRPGKRLVVVLLQGGPDGLALAAPTADPLYPYLRPTTALAPDGKGLDLGEGFVLHPALAPLYPLWQRKKLAVISACGLPGGPSDHAGALACFARGGTAREGGKDSGWLGRLSLALFGEKGQMLVGSLSPVFRGAPHYNLIAPGRGPSLPPPVPEDQKLFDGAGRLFDGKDALSKAFTAGRTSLREALAKHLAESRQAAAGAVPAPIFAGFGERFGKELAERRDAALGFVAVSGFDTHVGQGAAKGYLADRLAETAHGLAGLASGLGRAFEDTVVVALGEFGRRARENAFGGTDNGQGGVMLVVGGPVAGGRCFGRWPGLVEHRLAGGRDVAVTTDWRAVVGRIAVRHLGLAEKRLPDVFPGFTPGQTSPDVMG